MNIITSEVELRKVSEKVKLYEMKDLLKKMPSIAKFMNDNNGCGLTGIQIGINKTFFIASLKGRVKVFINPTILQYSEETTIEEEGCLSFPGISKYIERSKSIRMTFFDYGLKKMTTQTFSGRDARILQHEYDHTLGIICVLDKAIIPEVI